MNNTPSQPNNSPRPAVKRPVRAMRQPGEAPQSPGMQNVSLPAGQTPAVQRPAPVPARAPQAQNGQTPGVQRPAPARAPQMQNGQAPANQRPVPTPARAPQMQNGQAPANQQTAPAPAPARAPHSPNGQPPVSQRPVRSPQMQNGQRPAVLPTVKQVQEAPTTQVDLTAPHTVIDDNSATRRMDIPTDHEKKKKRPEDAEKKKKKQMSEGAATLLSIVKAITYIVFVIVLAGFLSYYIIRVANDMFAFVKSDEMVEVEIPEYATIDDVSQILAENGIITYPDVFKIYAKLNKDNGEFVAGSYTINAMMNYDELLMAFKEKFVRGTIRLTIPEGYTVDEIIDLFIENGVGMVEREEDVFETATREDYVAAVSNLELYAEYFEFIRALIGNMSEDRFYPLEGYLFPDTYEFYTDSKPSQIIYKLLNRFNNVFKSEFYDRADELGYTVDEIVTLASMVEKETRLYHEFESVSSVFHNRLRDPANYAFLESDATIMYAIHHDTGERKEDMTHEDVSYVSPYNTYTNRGLPPGPIANPSYQALTCALYPEDTEYYYFVSRKNGETIFSRTLTEHKAAVASVAAEG
ncbi:MAG: endolytic transglycosylase MltG [Clostridia bacterium]|nr:endolytic transglycosylase MltG [Clostridia bacterium]